MKDLFEWNFEQIEMVTMLPTGSNTHYNNFSFIVSYLSSCVLLLLLHMYNIKETTVCGNLVGLSAKPAVFLLFYFLADKTICMVLFNYNSNKPLKISFLELFE